MLNFIANNINVLYLILRLTIGIILFITFYPISACTGFNYTNCWIYAVNKYLENGGYLVFRVTNWNTAWFITWEHALWSTDLKRFYSLVPLKPKRKRLIPPILFIGKVISIENIDGELEEQLIHPLEDIESNI